MSCNCHGKGGIAVTQTAPYDQCSTCAKKHIVKAHELFLEFTYLDDNRDAISGQLRCAVDHLMRAHRDLALKVRDLAVMIEEARDEELRDEWKEVLDGVRQAFYTDHPDVVERLSKLTRDAR